MNRSWPVAVVFLIALAGCGGRGQSHSGDASSPLRIRTLHATVVRMGTLGSGPYAGQPLYGVRLRADVCARTHAEATRLYAITFRIAHYEPRTRKQTDWGRPFRTMANDQHWLVPFGETRNVCGEILAEDLIPPDNYGGVESPLGNPLHCWGVKLQIDASLDSVSGKSSSTFTSTARTIVQCGSFHPD